MLSRCRLMVVVVEVILSMSLEFLVNNSTISEYYFDGFNLAWSWPSLLVLIFFIIPVAVVMARCFVFYDGFGEVSVKPVVSKVEEFEVLVTGELDVSRVKCDHCGSPELVPDRGELFRCAHCGHLYKIRHEIKKGRMVR